MSVFSNEYSELLAQERNGLSPELRFIWRKERRKSKVYFCQILNTNYPIYVLQIRLFLLRESLLKMQLLSVITSSVSLRLEVKGKWKSEGFFVSVLDLLSCSLREFHSKNWRKWQTWKIVKASKNSTGKFFRIILILDPSYACPHAVSPSCNTWSFVLQRSSSYMTWVVATPEICLSATRSTCWGACLW